MTDENIHPDVFHKIYSGEKCLEIREVVTLFFNGDTTLKASFQISWCNVKECYTAEYQDENRIPLVVDEMTRAHILGFFEDHFRIIPVLGMLTEDDFETQKNSLALLEPTIVAQK